MFNKGIFYGVWSFIWSRSVGSFYAVWMLLTIMGLSIKEQRIRKQVCNWVAEKGFDTALQELSLVMLLPQNQQTEFRFLHLAEFILSSRQAVVPKKKCAAPADLNAIMQLYDSVYGAYFAAIECDFVNFPFVSWVSWNGGTYRTFSSTYADSELHLMDVVKKGCSLDKFFIQRFGFSFSEILDFILPRVHSFISAAFDDAVDQKSTNDKHFSWTYHKPDDKLRQTFDSYLEFRKNSLTDSESKMLRFLSKPPPAFKPNLNSICDGTSMVMKFPIVEFDDKYVLAFPQLLLPAILEKATDTADDALLASVLRVHICARSFEALGQRFKGESAQLVIMPSLQGASLADIALYFDKKLLLLTAFTPQATGMTQLIEGADALWSHVAAASERVTIRGNNRTECVIDPEALEVFHFAIVDGYSELVAACTQPKVSDTSLFDILTCKTLEFVLQESADALEFIKFIRMRHRAHRSTQLFEPGGPILDSFSIFKKGGSLMPLNSSPQMLVVDNQSFSSYYLRHLLVKRNDYKLLTVDGIPRKMWKQYPGCYLWNSDGDSLAFFNWADVAVKLRSSGAPSEEVYHAWHVTYDSLCYHLGVNAESLNLALNDQLRNCSALVIDLEMREQQIRAIESRLVKQDDAIHVEINISPAILDVFTAGDNQGERLVLSSLLEALRSDKLDSILPLSKHRAFQITKENVPHISWADLNVKAIPIYECDDQLIMIDEWKSLTSDGIQVGIYTEKKEIYQVLKSVLDSVFMAFKRRLSKYDRETLIYFSYTQLEAAYIDNERTKRDLVYASETAKDFDAETAYIEECQKGTNLTFAIRLILEAALQMSSGGKQFLTLEAFSELLAFADRFIGIDFQGDVISVLDRAGLPLPAVELTEQGFVRITKRDDVDDMVLHQHLFASHQSSAAKRHKPKSEVNQANGISLVDCFDGALKEELGLSLHERITLDRVVLSLFDDRKVPLLFIKADILPGLLSSKSGFAQDVISRYLNRVTLTQEHLLNQGDIKPSENYWRNARILNRPLILDGRQYLIARSVTYLAGQIFIERLRCCRISSEEASTDVLKNALGKWSNLEGERFRQELVEEMQENGWETYDEVNHLDDVAMPDTGMGPIDVIAVNKPTKNILLIEAKRTYFSRSPKDLLTELDNCFGKNKKRGEFQRFEEKVRWVRDHLQQLGTEYHLVGMAEWTIRPILVSSDALRCASLKRPTFDVMTELEFKEWLNSHSS